MFLIAGLGNPGQRYENTRHNAGFLVVERLAARSGAVWRFEDRRSAMVAEVGSGENRLLLARPMTFMNRSGDSIRRLVDYYKIPLDRIVVVVDDANLEFGRIRLRPAGSSGGHHGLESTERCLGSREFARQRIGIGRGDSGQREITGHVLGRFSEVELQRLDDILDRAADQVESFVSEGIGAAMDRWNGSVQTNENGLTK